MTHQEKIEQKIRLGVEVEEAKSNLAHERERVLRFADDLTTWAAWLCRHADQQPSAADFMPGGNAADSSIRSDGRLRECLNFDTLSRAEESLRAARQKAANLALRKVQLESPPEFQIKP